MSVTALDSLQAQRLIAGHSVSRLAQLANVSDRTIVELEIGGTVENWIAQQIADALGVTLVTLASREL